MHQFMSISEMRSMVCKMAYSAIKRYGITQSMAMRQAWQAAKLIRAMRSGVVSFRFAKVSTGEIREAKGMLLSPTAGLGHPADQVRYFDVEKEGFRSFLIHTLS